MFENGFPEHLNKDVHYLAKIITIQTYNNACIGQSEQTCLYLLNDDSEIVFPYRIYYKDILSQPLDSLSQTQNLIYHCIFSRSCDGMIREKHINALLSSELPYWAIPYIVKVCDEYVIEILECVYKKLQGQNNDEILLFCRKNIKSFCLSHNRMISYWNEFYRDRCYCYKNYIGKKLFAECFGYSRSMEKMLTQ